MSSSCGDRSGRPKISALDAWTNRTGRPSRSCTLTGRLEQPDRGEAVDPGGQLGLVPGARDRAERGQVVDLVGRDLEDQGTGALDVRDVTDVGAYALDGRVVRQRHRVHLDAVREQPLGEVAAVLAADAGDQRTGHAAQCV